MKRQPIVVGNWKMNGRRADLPEIVAMAEAADAIGTAVEAVVCPPITLLALAREAVKGSRLKFGAQTLRAGADGAFTGDWNAGMLADIGAAYCIVGHSERRRDYEETDAVVSEKAYAAASAGLTAIVCVGETLEERRAGRAVEVVTTQVEAGLPSAELEMSVIAYEPIWAIGTGHTPTLQEIAEIHDAIRAALDHRFGSRADPVRLLYGGSVKPSNAAEIFETPSVDGALVGGACLKATDFAAIMRVLAGRAR
jgi:triosephosphate isomerase